MNTASPAEKTPAVDGKLARHGILSKTHTGDPRLDKHLEYIRKVPWASTSLGPLESWPHDLLQLCHVCILDPQPRLLILGSDRVLFYNAEYAVMCGDKHPDILGQPIIEAWGDIAAYAVDVPLATAEATGRGVDLHDQSLIYERNGFLEEVFLSWTVIPLLGSTPGFYVTLTDVTETNLAEKRRAVLRALNAAWDVVKEPREFWQSITGSSALDPSLFPFAFLYAAEPRADAESSIDTSPDPAHEMRFKLAGSTGDVTITARLPEELSSDQFGLLSKSADPTLVRQSEASGSPLSCLGKDCILVPIRSNRSEKIIAYLFLGTNPKRPYNENYQEWMHELSRCLSNAATNVLLAEEEKRKQHYRAIQVAREQQLLATALANRDREAVAATDQYQRTLKVVDMANVGIFEYDTDGRLIYANDAFKVMVRCPSEMMNANRMVFLELTFPEDAEYLLSKWNCALGGTPCTFEMRFRTPGGQAIWVLAAVIPVFENSIVKSVSGCITNIHDTKLRETESVQRLKALERAKAWELRFVNFAEMAPIAIYFATQSSQKVSYCNPAWFGMTGHPVVPFDQIDWTNIVYEEDIELVRSTWAKVFSTNEPTTAQFRLRRSWADGNGVTIGPVWVTVNALPEYNEDGTIKGLIGTMLDISALKFAEMVQQMKAQEALEAKRQSSNFIDMTSHEIRNPLGAVFHCSDAAQETLADMTVLANQLASTAESNIGQQLHELIASGVDSVSTIISCSQHQKRIVDDILVLSKLDSNLLQINPSTVRVTTLLHDVEKMFEAEAQRSDVQLVTQAHASLEQMGVNWVLLDPGRVQQVLINLLTNAIKFCKKKNQRRVTIRVGASKIRPSENVLPEIDFVVAHSLHDSVYDDPKFESQSFYLWFSVEDTGRGMSADEKGRIFARFTQGTPRTESEYGGSGLGLFISRELAELQGGEIGVASELHVGSTFAFFVKTRHTEAPVIANLHNLTLQQKQQTDPTHTTKKSDINVLVVEDNAVNQKLLRQQLSKHGFTVKTADNGLDCLSQLRHTKHWRANTSLSAPSVEVILMDIEMPLMDGLQATKEIRKLEKEGLLTGHVPIIAVSANARQEQRDLAMDAGMDDSISKPFRIAELVPKIERLAGWT